MGYTIGIDIGGTKVLGGVVDESGLVIHRARRDTPLAGGAALTQAIADVALELVQEFTIDSVGISVAGFISADRKTILATPNIADWNGVNLDQELTSRIGLPVVIENDGNAAAWGEFKFGAGRVDGGLCSGPDVFVFDQSDGHQGDRGARGAVAGR